MSDALKPAAVCAALLSALDAAEGRRRMRKRDQTPDAIGLAIKRDLLEQAVRAAPPAERFEAWLMDYAQQSPAGGAAWSMARAVLDEWRLAHAMGGFAAWLACGAPSADAGGGQGASHDAPHRVDVATGLDANPK